MAISRMNQIVKHLRRAALQRDGGGLTDGQLWGRFVEHRDQAAFAALVKRHGPMVWGVCRRLLNHHDAEDAFQAAFLVLVRKAASIWPREMVGNWLYGVAHQTALKARATTFRRRARERQVMQMPEPAVAEPDLWHDLQPLLDQELSRLPAKYRVAIVLCDLEGKTRTEAARQLGCPEGTVAARLARARAMLAKRLARHGLPVSGGTLAAVLSQDGASASVPTSAVSSTIQAASLLAAGQAAAGMISVQVAALMEGVMKNMLLTKLKLAVAVVLIVGIIAIPAAGLTYRAMAGEGPNQQQTQDVESGPVKDQGGTVKELRRLKVEVERLRAEIVELRKGLQQHVRPGKTGDGKLVIKVYSVAGLTRPRNREGTEAECLMRVIANIIDPPSWNRMGGKGSMEYFPEGASLVIRQSPDIHKQVQALLDTLRKKTKPEREERKTGAREKLP
jgi:RNA polymerase sigma factor (sigma-70 family)